MTKTLKSLLKVGAIGLASLLTMKEAEAQLPFFTGQRAPATYTLENRTIISKENPEFTDIWNAKTFRKEIPLWGYVGNSYNNRNGSGDLFYGAGPIINIGNRLYSLPTVEGSGDEFSGVTFYSTLVLPKNFHVDFSPNLDEDLDHTSTSFNMGQTYKGLTFGISSDFKDGKLRQLEETDVRVARIRRGNFIDVGINPGKKKIRVAFQKTF